MVMKEVILFCFNIVFVVSYIHEKPVHLTLWPGKCTKGQQILNDCNWCSCDSNKFACKARVCNEVDMFGHFNDAIRDINVGMEGRGSWRSTATACEPGVQYDRGNLLCICGEDGLWPNPLCRDMFRVLHEVDTSKKDYPLKPHQCSPTKLYLIGCNVCFCPSTARLDPELCTKRNCTGEDPVFQEPKVVKNEKAEDTQGLEMYAECAIDMHYKFGCRSCTCFRNNRLICTKCDITSNSLRARSTSYCDSTVPGQPFNLECNLCVCDRKGLLYCTVKRCLGLSKTADILNNIKSSGTIDVDEPYDDLDCTPGTTYKKECNTCICARTGNGRKYYSCTLKFCTPRVSAMSFLRGDCVPGTVYEADCQVCRCDETHGVKMETCHILDKCTGMKAIKDTRSMDIKSLHGYCEPGHTYKKNCNTCRCLANGKVTMCTSHICSKIEKEPVVVDIVPISQKDGVACPKDHMYKVDCNLCFCLSNGNVLCSTADCSKIKPK